MVRLHIRTIIVSLLNALLYAILFITFTSNTNNDDMRTNSRPTRPQRRRETNIND